MQIEMLLLRKTIHIYSKCTHFSCRTAYAKGMGHSEAHDMVTMTEFQIVRETIW